MKCAGIAVVGAILCLLTRRQSSEFGVLAALGAGILVMTLGMSFFRPLLSFSQNLQETANLGATAVGPVYKALAMGFVTEIGAGICEDAGEKALASRVELAVRVTLFAMAAPLLTEVVTIVTEALL